MDLGLKNKVALVTAASQGLGKAAALALASEGARVVMCSRSAKGIRAAAREVHEMTGSEILPVVADISGARAIKALVRTATRRYGRIHIAVTNVGGPPTGDILTMPEAEWRRGYESILMSVVRLIREVLPGMIDQRWGRIIAIASITAKQPITDLITSSVLRPGLMGLAKVLSNRNARHGITFNTICPGFILTGRQEELMKARSVQKKMSLEDYLAETVREIPAGRMGKPEEIGNVIAFLASERASYINGTTILVDGGLARGI